MLILMSVRDHAEGVGTSGRREPQYTLPATTFRWAHLVTRPLIRPTVSCKRVCPPESGSPWPTYPCGRRKLPGRMLISALDQTFEVWYWDLGLQKKTPPLFSGGGVFLSGGCREIRTPTSIHTDPRFSRPLPLPRLFRLIHPEFFGGGKG